MRLLMSFPPAARHENAFETPLVPAPVHQFAVWPIKRPSSAVVSVNLMKCATWRRTCGNRTMLGRLQGAMRSLSFLLVTAAPLHALAQDERPVPPLPIPDVAPTATHIPHVAPTATQRRARLVTPIPQPRPAVMSTSAAAVPIAPKKTLVQIND
jgi:hypothetical protein